MLQTETMTFGRLHAPTMAAFTAQCTIRASCKPRINACYPIVSGRNYSAVLQFSHQSSLAGICVHTPRQHFATSSAVNTMYSTPITCGALRSSNASQSVVLSGWVGSMRQVSDSLLFIALRDAYGVTQVVVEADEGAAAVRSSAAVGKSLKLESVIEVRGTVRLRPVEMTNSSMPTGAIEVLASGITVLSSPSAGLPLVPGVGASQVQQLGGAGGTTAVNSGAKQHHLLEENRLQHRHLDIRRDVMQRNLRLRSLLVSAIRQSLLCGTTATAADSRSGSSPRPFVEVETPTLFRSSPEGAREFLVPTRHRGKFYALVQSPQQYKQLLMVGGIDRYFQIARCYRDEGGRADRQPEFTQVDLEMAFVDREHVMETVERMVTAAMGAARSAAQASVSSNGTLQQQPGLPSYDFSAYHLTAPLLHWSLPPAPLPRLTYAHCMAVYGSDKPDRRLGMPIGDVTHLIARYEAPLQGVPGIDKVAAYHGRTASSIDSAPGKPWYHPADDVDLDHLLPDAWCARAFVVPGLGSILSRKEMDALVTEVNRVCGITCDGTTGPSIHFAKVENETGLLKGSRLVKQLPGEASADLCTALRAKPGDMVVVGIGAGARGCKAMGIARLVVAETCRLLGLPLTPHSTGVPLGPHSSIAHPGAAMDRIISPTRQKAATTSSGALLPSSSVALAQAVLDLFWVTDFPLFEEVDADGGAGSGDATFSVAAAHHPFTAPVAEHIQTLMECTAPSPTLLSLRARSYDLVADGCELGGGSIRIHDAALQRHMLQSVLQVPPSAMHGFDTLLTALDQGAPPHGGFALGLDRFVAMIAGPLHARTIRDVVAFPKSSQGNDLLTGAPAEVTQAQLHEYHLSVDG